MADKAKKGTAVGSDGVGVAGKSNLPQPIARAADAQEQVGAAAKPLPAAGKATVPVTQPALEVDGKPLAPKKMSKVAPINPDDYLWRKPEEFGNIPLVLTGFELRDGQWGAYAVLNVVNPETGEECEVSYGGRMVVTQLMSLRPDKDLPASFIFQEVGGTWYMA